MAMTRGLVDVLNVLHKEEAALRTQLDKVCGAIAALGGGRQGPDRPKRKAKTTAGTVRKMTAAQKKVISARMKKYWAARRKAAKKS